MKPKQKKLTKQDTTNNDEYKINLNIKFDKTTTILIIILIIIMITIPLILYKTGCLDSTNYYYRLNQTATKNIIQYISFP